MSYLIHNWRKHIDKKGHNVTFKLFIQQFCPFNDSFIAKF